MATNTVDLIGDEALTDSIITRTITEIVDDTVDKIGEYAFYGCEELVSAEFPAVETIGYNSFSGCVALPAANFPAAKFVNMTAFYGCSALASVSLPAVLLIHESAFGMCTALTEADLPVATQVGDRAFSGSGLKTLILRNTAGVATAGVYPLGNTPIASGGGYIYVPSALVASYKAATNWSTYAAQFRALEEYTVDGTTTGALDPEKLISFADSDWSTIAEISEAGNAASYFKVGDKRTITAGGKELTLRIIGFNHDTLSDGTGKAGITVLAGGVDSTDGGGMLSDTTTSVSNWTSLASFTKNTLKPQLPADLQAVIKSVSKPCDGTKTNGDGVITNVTFDIFPLSWDEMKIQVYAGRNIGDSDWRKVLTELGTPYALFANGYNATYMGPYNVDPYVRFSIEGSWMRQWFRGYDSSNYTYYEEVIYSTSKKYTNVTSSTAARPVMMAFCI